MSVQQAPTPWTVTDRIGAVSYIVDANALHFAAITGTPEVVSYTLTAVNQHEALLDALRAIVDLCSSFNLPPGERLEKEIAIRSIATEALKAAGEGS